MWQRSPSWFGLKPAGEQISKLKAEARNATTLAVGALP
jgi:hypothetical protein